MNHPSRNPICRLAADPSDRLAWTAAVEAYGALCWRIATRMLGDQDAAADAVQDALLAIRSAAGRFQPGADPDGAAVAWMARVVVNTCHAHLRRRRPAAPLPNDLVSAGAETMSEASAELLEHLQTAIAELPEALREAVSLRYLAGLDNQGVAVALGLEPGAARVRIHRAVDALRGRFAKRGLALSVVALCGVLDGVAQAACPPLPAGTLAALSGAPLPPVAAVPSTTAAGAKIGAEVAVKTGTTALIGWSVAVVAAGVLALGVVRAQRSPALPIGEPPTAAVAVAPVAQYAPAVAAPAPTPAAAPAQVVAWEPLFPGPDLAGWDGDRGTWELRAGQVHGRSVGERGARLRSSSGFADGELTCRVRLTIPDAQPGEDPGARQGEIQLDDYRHFVTLAKPDERWRELVITQRGGVITCTCDGVALPVEAGEPGPQRGSLAFYVTRDCAVDIADARYRRF